MNYRREQKNIILVHHYVLLQNQEIEKMQIIILMI